MAEITCLQWMQSLYWKQKFRKLGQTASFWQMAWSEHLSNVWHCTTFDWQKSWQRNWKFTYACTFYNTYKFVELQVLFFRFVASMFSDSADEIGYYDGNCMNAENQLRIKMTYLETLIDSPYRDVCYNNLELGPKGCKMANVAVRCGWCFPGEY